MQRVEDIRQYFRDELALANYVTDKTGVKTLEMVGACFLADEEAIFGEPNKDYIDREIEWYNSMSPYVDDIRGNTPQIWKDVADKDGKIHSNYGYLVYSPENGHQFFNCLKALIENPDTRRAIMIYTRPSIQEEFNSNGMSDFICTNTVQYVIRNKRLHAIVNMRSNDVIFGYRNDWAWQHHVLHKLTRQYNEHITNFHDALATDLVGVGDIIWQVGSLHVYERHFEMIQ